jgi:hypothetical protein
MINHGVADWNDDSPPLDLVTFSMKTSWYGTIRGRIGTTTGPALLYLTGGAAWVSFQDGILPVSAAVPGSITSKTGTGWTWGGGTKSRSTSIGRRNWNRSTSTVAPAIVSYLHPPGALRRNSKSAL